MSDSLLSSLLTLATAAVIIGVVLEGGETFLSVTKWKKLSCPKRLEAIGFAVLVLGLAGEWLASREMFGRDAAKIEAQQRRILALTTENAELERIMVPRRLPTEDVVNLAQFLGKVCPKMDSVRGMKVLVQWVPEQEPERFAQELTKLLNFRYGWKFTAISPEQSELAVDQISDGVVVYVPSSKAVWDARVQAVPANPVLLNAADALNECMNTVFGPGSSDVRTLLPVKVQNFSFPYFEHQPKGLFVTIGASPIAERLYELRRSEK